MIVIIMKKLLIWFFYFYKKAYKLIIKRIELVDEAFETLGLSNNYREIFINSVLKILTWIVMISFVILFDAYFLMQTLNLSQCLHVCYLLHYPVQLNCVIDLTFSSLVKYVFFYYIRKALYSFPNLWTAQFFLSWSGQ